MLRWVLCSVLIICIIVIVSIVFIILGNSSATSVSSSDVDVKRDVEIDTGTVRGHLVSEEEGDYFAYLGIPYAAPQTSSGRFKDPLPPVPWDGIFQANRIIECPQRNFGIEDCHVVNVFTPVNIINGLAPVLVYIHSGAFLVGTSPKERVASLIKHNIILVTFNYRLGVLGFLCLGTEEAPGNAALKDQTAALKWVQKNIQNFGGDPAQVTLHGMSAGGASVELHVLSKLSTGLFQRAIVEGASALPVWVTDADPIHTALDFAKTLQLPKHITKNVHKFVHYFQHESAAKLSRANFDYYLNLTDSTFGFAPCVERKLYNQKTFLSKSPHEILSIGDYTKVPIMFIFSSSEGLFFISDRYEVNDYKHRMEANFLDFLPADLIFDSDETKQEVGMKIKRFYFGNETIGDGNYVQWLNYFGDHLVLHGLLNSAEMHARGGNPVYVMEFAYKGKMGTNPKSIISENITMTGHGDMVKHAILTKSVHSKDDEQAVERVAKLITNFVTFGDPTPTPTQLLPVPWPRFESKNFSYLHMDKEFKVLEKPYWERKEFWDTLYSNFRKRIKPVDPMYCNE